MSARYSPHRGDGTAPLMSITGLTVAFPDARGGAILEDVAFSVRAGETLCLVGESGSGKSVTCLSILGLLPDRLVADAAVTFRGDDVSAPAARAALRGRRVGMVFQDPFSSLNPVRTIGSQLLEVIAVHLGLSGRGARAKALSLLAQVGVPSAGAVLAGYPHELSGGLNQRVAIALALAPEPALLVADEPTTALDVTVQAQILGLLRHLQRERDMGLLLVTHDLGIVAESADRVVVLYAGQVMETGPVGALLARPRHPYTAALIEALPRLGGSRERLATIPGTVPAVAGRPSGCVFAARCRRVQDICWRERPPHRPSDAEGSVACHFPL